MDLLSLIVFLPLAGALLLAFVPAASTRRLRAVAFLVTGVVAVLGVWLLSTFDGSTAEVQRLVDREWFRLPGSDLEVGYRLGVDGLSILMVGLTTLLVPVVLLSTLGHVERRTKEFLLWLLVMETGMLGVFLALDLVLFYFFWEVSLVPLYFIVGIWGGERRLYATVKFFLYTLAGSLVMLVGVLALVYATGTSDVTALVQRAPELAFASQLWMFLAFALAFSIKVPLWPFHTWLADAHTEAPTSGSVLLAGVLLKMGTYGLLRFGIQTFPAAALACAPAFMALGAIGIVYGALLAMAQRDLKRLIACSSVSHLGFVVLGMFAMTAAGLRGGILQMVNHGLSTGLLFLLVGAIYERRHRRGLDDFGGLAARMPLFALFFVVAVLASIGLPGLNGFVGEYLILLGAFQVSPWLSAVGVSGVVLGAVYLLSATRRVLYGPLREPNAHLADLAPREVWTMAPLLLACVWIGVRPGPFLDLTAGSVDALVERVEDARERRSASLEPVTDAPLPQPR